MSAWSWYFTPSKRFDPPQRSRRPYARTAQHIRGRVFRMDHRNIRGDWMWGMEVVNTATGRVIASDNRSHRPSLLDLCDEATAAARAAWFWSFSPKKVKHPGRGEL